MDRLGLVSEDDRIKISRSMQQKKARQDQFSYIDRKFTRGTAVTNEEQEHQRAIKNEYSGMERVVGAAWEKATFANGVLMTKFMNNRTPLDVYRDNYVYGKSPIKRWENPIGDFIEPYAESVTNKRTIASSAGSMGGAGFLLGGPMGAALGAGSGALWGVLHGREDVPEYTQNRSEILKQIDTMTYMRSKNDMANGVIGAQETMNRTMTHAFNKATTAEQMMNSLPKTEREFVKHFANAGTAEERERIMNLVPDYAQFALNKTWNMGSDGRDMIGINEDNPMNEMEQPDKSWAGFDPTLRTEDIAVKMLNKEGIDARSAGLGYQAQQRRMLRNPFIPDSFETTMKTTTPDMGKIRNIVKSALPGADVNILPTQMPGFKIIVKGTFNDRAAQFDNASKKYGI